MRKWLSFLSLFVLFVIKCYYLGLSSHKESWFSFLQNAPPAQDLIVDGFWEIVEAMKEFDWVTIVNVIECVKKMQETGLL